ncbi:nuclear RNA export factor 1 [Tetranychus urticae]|uniref:NTF2 domain-containing protein n=1 Tax=Tetranychus urticae TaxID=32264 RepID=T1KYL1_TETUR|nr:nuclear RNA export factor 1 [Tetranychus urticae]
MMDNWRREARFTNRRSNYPKTIENRKSSYEHTNNDNRSPSKKEVGPRYGVKQLPKRKYRYKYQRNNKDDSQDDNESWFKIVIPRGAKCPKEHLMTSLQQNMSLPLMALNFHAESNTVVFFVQGGDQMQAIRACSRRIYDNNGYALTINVQPSQIPVPPINKMVEDKISDALKGRYNYSLRSLYLNSFSQEPSLLEANLYIPLSRPSVFNLVVEKIRKEYSEIVGLSVADNKLTSLQPLSHLQSICKNLKALDISKNKIRSISELDNIKGLDLIEIAIEGNPFANAAAFSESEKSALVSSLRTRFPKLAKLDGTDLPPAIGFDVGDSDDIPPSYGHHIPNEIKNFVAEFLDQYFKIYDSDDRRPMLAAYHDQAVFSYSIGRTDNKINTFTQSMIAGSRNLLRIREEGEAKTELLHVGGSAIVEALMSMPRTKHAPSLMKIDVPFYFQQNFFVVVVNGVFKEFTKKQVHTRAFGRTFIIVPQGQGFVIINDILVITNATVEQVQKFSRSLENDSIITCIKEDRFGADCLESLNLGLDQGFNLNQQIQPQMAQMQPQPVQTQPILLDQAAKDSMVQQFCSLTNMNLQFSTQCLEENAYDLQKSFEVFEQLNKQGAIPAAAFVQ